MPHWEQAFRELYSTRHSPLKDFASALYPFVKRGTLDVAGGHHDAGDYSKYTINSAGLIHTLVFAVDVLPGVAQLDNLRSQRRCPRGDR